MTPSICNILLYISDQSLLIQEIRDVLDRWQQPNLNGEMLQPSDEFLPRMNYNISSLRPTNYSGSQTVTTSEASFISVDEGAEKLMWSGCQSEAQEDTFQVPQESINLDQFFQPGDGKVCIISHVN